MDRWTDILARGLTLRKLAFVGTAMPLSFLAVYSYVWLVPARNLLDTSWGAPLLIATVGLSIAAFSALIFGAIARLQHRVERLSTVAERRNVQLRSLNDASLVLSREMLASTFLQRVADLSRELVRAKYATLFVFGENGREGTQQRSGMGEATQDAMQGPPTRAGLLGLVTNQEGPMRIDRMSEHPAFTGFPPNHPAMTTFLGVPIRYAGKSLGSLYMTEKQGGGVFTAEDEEIALMFANQAAVAIQNSRLYDQVQTLAIEAERSRISREMHDGLAQVLSFVNTKALAVEAFLKQDDVKSAREHVTELSEAAREVYRDIREGILALRTRVGLDATLREVLDEYVFEYEHLAKLQVVVGWEISPDELGLEPFQEVQILRIIQESLTNVRKHSDATAVSLDVVASKNDLVIEINDNGNGFNPLAPIRGEWPHFGIQAMRERAETIGGTLEIESAPGQGATVRLRVPDVVRSAVTDGVVGGGQ